jgi:hypothetical protein
MEIGDHIKVDLSEVDGTGSGWCPVAEISISRVELFGYKTEEVAQYF